MWVAAGGCQEPGRPRVREGVEPHDPHTTDPSIDRELDALLRRTRPQPDPAWIQSTRDALLPERAVATRAWWRPRPVAIAATIGLAATLTVAALSGGGPLGGAGGDEARAVRECRDVYVTQVEPLGEVRRRADGTVEVQTVERPVTRVQRECTER